MPTVHCYDHCPFCNLARCAVGLKNAPVSVAYIQYADIDKHMKLINAKMAPIFERDDGTAFGESMDIFNHINSTLGDGPQVAPLVNADIPKLLSSFTKPRSLLCMPRAHAMALAEFPSAADSELFKTKKEVFLGCSFEEALADTPKHLAELAPHLASVEALFKGDLSVNGNADVVTMDDVIVFSHLRLLSSVKGIVFPPRLGAFLKHFADKSKVPLFEGI